MKEYSFEKNRFLKDFSTFGIGGPARDFVIVEEISEMQEIMRDLNAKNEPFLIIGKGSNCLFDEKGFDGVVILNRISHCKQLDPGIFQVGAGYSFSYLGISTARQGWSGLEFASGIPGSVGGAVYMNAGANGQETADTLCSIRFISEQGDVLLFKREELTFSYRSSPFQSMRGVIVEATFQLIPCSEAREKQKKIVNYRIKTQPYGEQSAGCIFRNPPERSAGALIDSCGLKGLRIGDAQVSERHANFIVNLGSASSEEILKLINLIRQKVEEQTGISLESEVKVIPYREKP